MAKLPPHIGQFLLVALALVPLPGASGAPTAPPRVLDALTGALDDVDRGVRFAAAQALGRIGPDAAAAVPRLAVLQNDREWCVRGMAVKALGRVGPASLPALRKGFADRTEEERVMVIRALAWVGEEARPFLEARAGDEGRVPEAASESLELLGREERAVDLRSPAPRRVTSASEVEGLVADLDDPWLDTQFRAREALLGAGGAAAKPLALALGWGRYDVLWHAEEIFRVLGPHGAAGMPDLAMLLDHEDENVREVAARLLGEIGPQAAPAVPRLIGALRDRRIAVRDQAMVALGRIGDGAVTPLLLVLEDPDARVRAGAACALGWIHARVSPVPYQPRLPVAEPGPATETGWAPDAELLKLAGRVGIDLDFEETGLNLDFHDRARSTAILRAGLRLRDVRAATACAARLSMENMDAWEAERAVELLLPECFRDEPPKSFWHIYEYFASEEMAAAVCYFSISGRSREDFLAVTGPCHRLARPDFIPFLHQKVGSPDDWATGPDSIDIAMPISWSDRYREATARAWAKEIPADDRAGLPPGLRGMLADHEYLGDRVRRWLLDSRPAPEDAELLLSLVESRKEEFRNAEQDWQRFDLLAVLLSMGWLADLRTEAVLREFADEEVVALAALVRRGDAAAKKKLVRRSGEDEDALALLLSVAPARGRQVLLDQLLGTDPHADPYEGRAPCWEMGGELAQFAFHGVSWDAHTFAGLTEAVLEAEPDTDRLARIAVTVPGLRNRKVAAVLFDRLAEEGPASLVAHLDPDFLGWMPLSDLFSFLYAADPDRVRTLLRRWAREEEELGQMLAVRNLIRMGDPESGPLLVAWLRAHPDGFGDSDGIALELAGSSSPEVEAYLRAELEEDEGLFPALARLAGLPYGLAWQIFPGERTEEERAKLLALVEEDPLAALFECLWDADSESYELPGWLGLHADPRVLPFLKKLREDPSTVSMPKLLGQLAIAGDRRARAEFWSAVRAGRYRWICYESEYEALSLGWDPESFPFLLYDTEGNCCRGGHVARMFEGLMNEEHLSYEPHGIDGSPIRNARRWIELHGGSFVPCPFVEEHERMTPAVR